MANIIFPITRQYAIPTTDLPGLPTLSKELIQLIWLTEGSLSGKVNGQNIHGHTGDILVLNCNDFFVFEKEASGVCHLLSFNPEMLKGNHIDNPEIRFISPLQMGEKAIESTIASDHPASGEIHSILKAILDLLEHKKDGYELLIKSRLYELIYLLHHHELVHETPAGVTDSLHTERVMTIANYVSDHYQRHIPQDEVTELVGLSTHYFCRFFKKTTGTTFTEYLNRYRLDKALGQLTSTDRPIIDIALDCGFSDLPYFYRLFKKYFGQTPLSYRKGR